MHQSVSISPDLKQEVVFSEVIADVFPSWGWVLEVGDVLPIFFLVPGGSKAWKDQPSSSQSPGPGLVLVLLNWLLRCLEPC